MEVIDLPDASPGPGQLLIATEAIGVGGVDAMIRRGTLGSGFSTGLIPGSEVAGRVIGVGIGVEATWVGQRVWAFTGVGGAYAQLAVAAVDDVSTLPAALSSTDAVALGSAAPVAHFALAHARFAPGEAVLIRGAAGSIGIMAVQLASLGGASTVGVTASSPERGERLRKYGANVILDRSGHPDDAREFDVVIDVVGGEGMPGFLERLAPNGRFVAVGIVAGYPPADFGMALLRSFQKSLSFATFSLNTVPVPDRNRTRAEQFEAAARGDLEAVVHDVLPLAHAPEAHHRMDTGEVFGRIVLVP
jgi:NADPH:quinone reductase-like Zn-dependent oxidoreductase